MNSNSHDLDDGTKSHYLRFKLQCYEGGILRAIVDDVNIVKHRRFRTSASFGFETQNMVTTQIKIRERSDERVVFEMEDWSENRMEKRWKMYSHTDSSKP